MPDIDWSLYGSVCYRHREAIIKILSEPLQPSEIKRRARIRFAGIRMSANNVRDVMRIFVRQGIVRKIYVKRQRHPRYELTEQSRVFRDLLLQAEVPL